MTSVLYGALGAGLISGSDVIARWTTPRVSFGAAFVAMMGFSSAALAAWLWAAGDLPRYDARAWALALGSGAFNPLALALLYAALARGPVSVASPATAAFAPLLGAMNAAVGEPFGWTHGASLGLVFAGVVALARPERRDEGTYDGRWLRVTAALGLGAAACVASRLFVLQEAGETIGALPALWLNRLTALGLGVGVVAVEMARRRFRSPAGRVAPLLAGQAALETLALSAFVLGSAAGDRIGAAIGFATFPAFTALGAWLFLRDRVGARRSGWIAVVVAGAMLATAA